MAGSKEFRDKIEERKGTEWYDSAKTVGDLHDPHMSRDGVTERYSGAEIRAEMRAGRGDMSTEELTKKYEDLYASGEINLNGNAKEYLRDNFGANLVRNSDGSGGGGGDDETAIGQPVPDNEGKPPSIIDNDFVTTPGFPTNPPGKGGLLNSMIQNVNQDNDITNNISGDNNTVENTQDNSVSQSMGSSAYADRAARGLKDKYVLNLLDR